MSIKEHLKKWYEEQKIEREIANITPADLREMMHTLRANLKNCLAIEDFDKREEVKNKEILPEIEKISDRVKRILKRVDKEIESLSTSKWWATNELRSIDLDGIKRGRETLVSAQEELEKMRKTLEEQSSAVQKG